MSANRYIDLEALKNAELNRTPYPYVIVKNAISPNYHHELDKAFPNIDKGGSFSLEDVPLNETFNTLIQELKSDALREIIATKFSVNLDSKPTMITLRGVSTAKDGRIHTDSKSKFITVLLYFNRDWRSDSGRLRVLNGKNDLEDYAEEISPEMGNLLMFKVNGHDWHGYKPFIGCRRSIQLNFMVNSTQVNKHLVKHRISAKFKSLKKVFGQ
ncbi:MAG: 2OG-Fe(II) oxygenase [Pseudomonadota bacterium]